ncbi:helix-turn-helix domain-containing protein [Chryseobacterium sp. S-02]|uniref:helix-turn-helix domain-containing protein n=1 Tax=Chryseobacterium sp. S-02 TaxID=3404064 RepID=UPI003CF44773
MVYLLALTVFFCSSQVNAQNFSLSSSTLIYERKNVAAPSISLINEDYINHKIINKVVGFSFIVLLFIVLLLAYRVKGKGNNSYMITKYVSHIFRKQKNDKDTPSQKDLQTTEISGSPVKILHSISTETYNSILKKISKFEKSEKFLRKDINLTWLSNHLNTNTKYLSEVIKNHTGKNFNGYINGLRIGYIINKLTEMPVYRDYKISYLAEESGYASPQVFAIAFKRETGMTPSHFIEQLKNGANDTAN